MTITPSVRYLSILCWGIQVYGNARRPDSWGDFTYFTSRMEAAVAVAIMLIDSNATGIIGAIKAFGHLVATYIVPLHFPEFQLHNHTPVDFCLGRTAVLESEPLQSVER